MINHCENQRGILIVVSGFSGAGKGTLMKQLVSSYDEYSLSVSMTTRQPRSGEVDGLHYFFSDRFGFEKKIAEDGFIEYAEYCGNYYGTPRAYIDQELKEGHNVILEIEIQGARKIKEKFPDSLLLFVMPPNAAELKRRLIGRGTEDQAVIEKRLERAVQEAEGIEQYDYIVINDDLMTCVEEIHEIVKAARNVPVRRQEFIRIIREELKELVKGD